MHDWSESDPCLNKKEKEKRVVVRKERAAHLKTYWGLPTHYYDGSR